MYPSPLPPANSVSSARLSSPPRISSILRYVSARAPPRLPCFHAVVFTSSCACAMPVQAGDSVALQDWGSSSQIG